MFYHRVRILNNNLKNVRIGSKTEKSLNIFESDMDNMDLINMDLTKYVLSDSSIL